MRKLSRIYEALQAAQAFDEVLKTLALLPVATFTSGQTKASQAIAAAAPQDAQTLKRAIKAAIGPEEFENLRKLDPTFNPAMANKIAPALGQPEKMVNGGKGIFYMPWLLKAYILGDDCLATDSDRMDTFYRLSCLSYATTVGLSSAAMFKDSLSVLKNLKSIDDLDALVSGMPPMHKLTGGEAPAAEQGAAVPAAQAELGSYAWFISKAEFKGDLKAENREGVKRYESAGGLIPGQDYELIGMEGNCIAVSMLTHTADNRASIPQSTAWCTSWPTGDMFNTYIRKGSLIVLWLFNGNADPNKAPDNKWQMTLAVKGEGDDFKNESDGSITIGYDNESTPEILAKMSEGLRKKICDYAIQKNGVTEEEAYSRSKLINYLNPEKWPSRLLQGMSVADMLKLYGLIEGQNCEIDEASKTVYVTDPEYVYEDTTNFGDPTWTSP